MKEQKKTVIEAVARRFSATWEKSTDSLDACLSVDGKRVAVDIAILKSRGAGQGTAAKLRLRFDKVATGLMEELKATLHETVPERMTVLVDHHRSDPFAIENRCHAGRQNTRCSRARIAGWSRRERHDTR